VSQSLEQFVRQMSSELDPGAAVHCVVHVGEHVSVHCVEEVAVQELLHELYSIAAQDCSTETVWQLV
jgi:hypothetical protein